MTALAPRFGLTGDVQCFAGEVLSAELAFTNGSDATVPLTGRQFAMTVWVADTTRAEVASVAGEIVSDSSGHYARFAIGGDATEAMYQAHGALGLRVMIAELLDDGFDAKVEGALRIRPSPAGITPDAAASTAGPPVSRYTFDASTRRTIVSARGAPGLSAYQLAVSNGFVGTLDAYLALPIGAATVAGAAAGGPAGATAGAAAGGSAGASSGATAGAASGEASGATAGAAAGATASRLTVDTVTTGAPGSAVAVAISGAAGAQKIAFAIPKGDTGDVTPAATAARDAAQTAAATATAKAGVATDGAAQAAESAASIANLIKQVVFRANGTIAFADLYGRAALRITAAGQVVVNTFKAATATLGALVVSSTLVMGRQTRTVRATTFNRDWSDTDAFGRERIGALFDGSVKVPVLRRASGAKVYDQIDAARATADQALAAAGSGGKSANTQLLIAAFRRGFFPRPYPAGQGPTLTLLSANAATGIAGSVLVGYADAKFRYLGGTMQPFGPQFPKNLCATVISSTGAYTDASNTTPSYRGGNMEVEFRHSGSVLELVFRTYGGTLLTQLYVDGRSVVPFSVTPLGTGAEVRVRVDFGSVAVRRLRILTQQGFCGVQVASAAEVMAPDTPVPPIIMSLGDSLWQQTGALIAGGGMSYAMAHGLGGNLFNNAIGSTGIVQQMQANDAGTGQPLRNYVWQPRLDLFCNPNALLGVVPGSQNDSSAGNAQWPAGATTLAEAVFINSMTIADAWFAVNPGKPLVFLSGTWPTDLAGKQMYLNRDAIHQAAMARYAEGALFVDQLRPNPVTNGLSNTVQTTGTPGADYTTGNSGIYLGGTAGTDTAHPAPAGHSSRGLLLADQVRQKIMLEAA